MNTGIKALAALQILLATVSWAQSPAKPAPSYTTPPAQPAGKAPAKPTPASDDSLFSSSGSGLVSSPQQNPKQSEAVALKPLTTTTVSASRVLNFVVQKGEFSSTPLRDVLQGVADQTGVNMVIQWQALEQVGVLAETPVELRLRNTPVHKLIRLALDSTGSGELLTFYVEDNVLIVTTREAADAVQVTRVYDVSDLLIVVPPIERADQEFGTVEQADRGSSGGQIFDSGGGSSGEELKEQQEELTEKLVELIQSTIRPDIWQEAGGTASVKVFRNKLIVTAPRSVHERLYSRLLINPR